MEINGDQPSLIWPQFDSTGYTLRKSSIPTMLGPAAIGVVSAAIFLVIVNFVVPPFLSITSQILQPASVKRGWDSINVVLVVFAILCGVLARSNDDRSSSSSHGVVEGVGVVTSGEMSVGKDSKMSSSSEQWFDDEYEADRLKIYGSFSNRSLSSFGLPVTGTQPLRRSSSSYPDLRNGVIRETADRRFKFYDDFGIDMFRSHDSRSYEQLQNSSTIEIEESEPKEILVDKFVVRPSSPPPQQPHTPPPPPQAPRPSPIEVSQKPRRTHRSVKNRDTHENTKRSVSSSDSTRFKRILRPPQSPIPPPPPPPPVAVTPPRKQGSLQRRKSNAAKEIKMVLASLYNQGKRKKKLQKSKRKEKIESTVVMMVTESQSYHSLIPPPSSPPPPPPPPPALPRSTQSVLYGLFKKGIKSKRIHSVPTPPPPPPPARNIQLDPQTLPRRMVSGRPPRPTKPTNFNEDGQASPLIQKTPPPPPPPPFRVPPLKYIVSGDFAKIQSNQSSRCSSPEREVIDLGWGLELTQSEGEFETNFAVRPGFCPSPDVNTKADNFIARLRDEWRLDKFNSVNGKKENELCVRPNTRSITKTT